MNTNTIASILKSCEQRGIILKPIDDQHLEYSGPRESINEELLETLRQHKREIIQVLTVLEIFDGHVVEMSATIH
jgi:hypothetical protein